MLQLADFPGCHVFDYRMVDSMLNLDLLKEPPKIFTILPIDSANRGFPVGNNITVTYHLQLIQVLDVIGISGVYSP